MDPKIQLLSSKISAAAETWVGRSPAGASMFPHGLGAPDGFIARGRDRFRPPQVPGAATPIGQSLRAAEREPLHPARAAESPRPRLRTLLVNHGEPVPTGGLDGFDVVAVRLRGPDRLVEVVRELSEAASDCSAARLVIVDDDLPVWSRSDAQPKDLRPYSVSVVEERRVYESNAYEFMIAPPA